MLAALRARIGVGAFTLQLGAFSAVDSAQTFIDENDLAPGARVQRRRKGNTSQYLVLYGSYAERSQADRAKQALSRFEPWVRSVSEI